MSHDSRTTRCQEEGMRMDKELERYKQFLKDKGMKTTGQRLAIFEVLASEPNRHFTAEEIYEKVKQRWPEIGLATVYRNIQKLSEFGAIDKLNLGDGFVRYEIGDPDRDKARHHHHHLICLECGGVFTFEDDLLEQLEGRIRETMGFIVSDHEVKFYGRCSACSQSLAGK